jgi:hypothetical protein
MLLEVVLILMALDFIVFGVAFFRKNEWLWAIALVLSAVLVFAAYNIEQNIAVVDNQTSPSPGVIHFQYTVLTHSSQDKTLSYINFGMFLLGLPLFLNDLFINFREHKSMNRGQPPHREKMI